LTAAARTHEGRATPNSVEPTRLPGRFMMPDMSEHPCEVIHLTVTGATFLTRSVAPAGTSIVAYIENLGRVEAISGDATEGGFEAIFDISGSRRDKLETRIKWLGQRPNGAAPQRRHPRLEPREGKSQITFPDGRAYSCEIIDISLSGAGLKVDVVPVIGTYVMVGKKRAHVVRHLDNGIGVEFVKTPESSGSLFDS
jgi:PilZ domain